ncbi:MAG: SDR family oxidoreductase [Rhodospirillaceae bacterium]|jgi:3-oxoacyl-[acyl-carrier protein] reductase|nr:SDR family oxidoreductase [Rhodospirillaceae bacterium]MBT4489888.1 SDR family oxidoreductase [Rhodospirillaceae bacterium]MBT5195163.1 SDR family oxidoreductase [Rhodospirillaceae bacterium]MBT6429108.1 SDR family oxidoreductase [Rhodospirillaceae bacterium]MBT7760739.1 SDR family oxidoreductase [Rhodospirillaceae bacterium]
MQVKDWVVIITGGGTGVGAAAALMLAKDGARITINYSRSAREAEETAKACEDLGAETLVCQGDVSKDEDCRRIVAETMAKWGRIDGLMNNAGTTMLVADNNLESLSADDFLHIYSVNVVGAYQMTRAVAPHMKAQGRGSIVNTSSVAGVMGIGSSIAYAASKGAMNTMTLSLARELAPEIRVNAIAPGFITGRWWLDKLGQDGYDKMVANIEKSTPLNHAGTPEDMAEAALFFLTSSANITGEILISDAGTHLSGAPLIAR